MLMFIFAGAVVAAEADGTVSKDKALRASSDFTHVFFMLSSALPFRNSLLVKLMVSQKRNP
jgi:hypothetical protein